MKAIYVERISRVSKMAWRLVKGFGFTMSEAMKKAWAMTKMRAKMNDGIVEFYYMKKDGTKRFASGTLSHNIVPQTQGDRQPSKNCFVYYDTDKNAWRSFCVNNFIGFAA